MCHSSYIYTKMIIQWFWLTKQNHYNGAIFFLIVGEMKKKEDCFVLEEKNTVRKSKILLCIYNDISYQLIYEKWINQCNIVWCNIILYIRHLFVSKLMQQRRLQYTQGKKKKKLQHSQIDQCNMIHFWWTHHEVLLFLLAWIRKKMEITNEIYKASTTKLQFLMAVWSIQSKYNKTKIAVLKIQSLNNKIAD